MSTLKLRITTSVALLVLAATSVTACSDGTAQSGSGPLLGPGSDYRVPDDRDAQIYFKSLATVNASAPSIDFSQDLVEHMPNQQFVVNDGAPTALSDGVVVGDVVRALPGAAFVIPEGKSDTARGRIVPFDSDTAEWRVARLRIAVTHWFADGPAPETVDVGAFIAHPAGKLGNAEMEGLEALGEVIVVLDPDRTYTWAPSTAPIGRGGALLGDIDEQGEIGFPGLGTDSGPFVDGATVQDLENAWRSDPAPIHIGVNMETGELVRE